MAFRLSDLSKRKPEIQASHNCLCKDSKDSFDEAIQNF